MSVIKVNFCNYITKKFQYIQQLIKILKKAKHKQKYNDDKTTFQNRLYQDEKEKNTPGTLIFLALYFLSQLSGIYLNDVRANIKIKNKRKIILLTPYLCWVRLQRWKNGTGGVEGESQRRKSRCRGGGV